MGSLFIMLDNLTYIALLGGLGALSRLLCIKLLSVIKSFPFAVIVANTIASFILGLLYFSQLEGHLKLLLMVGFVGSLSTLSSVCSDFYTLFSNKQYVKSALYLLLNIILSLVAIHVAMRFICN